MEEIKLSDREIDALKEDSYFRGVVLTKLKELRGDIERIDKRLEVSNGTVLTLIKRTEKLDAHSGVHWLLIVLIIGSVVKIAFF